MKKIMIIFAVILSTVTCLAKEPITSPVVFSEFTVDDTPGTEGSWIELYNQSNESISLSGYTIICNDQKIFTFPKMTGIGAHAMALIIYKTPKDTQNYCSFGETYYSKCNNLVRRDPKKMNKTSKWGLSRPIIAKRTPGYIALFKSPEIKKENLVDMITWGIHAEVYATQFNKKIYGWTKKWYPNQINVLVGVDPDVNAGIYPLLPMKIIVNRKIFDSNNKNYLTPGACPESEATPGEGNIWAPPMLSIVPVKNENSIKKLQIEISASLFFIKIFKNKKFTFQIQIAKDPHFEKVIYDKRINSNKAIHRGYMESLATITDFHLKKYSIKSIENLFYRIRLDSKEISTNWARIGKIGGVISYTKKEETIIKKAQDDNEEEVEDDADIDL